MRTPSTSLQALARSWLEHQRALALAQSEREQTAILDADIETSERVDSLIENSANEAMDFVVAALSQTQDPVLLACIAAGPLEELLVYHGVELIEEIESLAESDIRFKELLGGVWKNTIADDVWQRVQRAACGT